MLPKRLSFATKNGTPVGQQFSGEVQKLLPLAASLQLARRQAATLKTPAHITALDEQQNWERVVQGIEASHDAVMSEITTVQSAEVEAYLDRLIENSR